MKFCQLLTVGKIGEQEFFLLPSDYTCLRSLSPFPPTKKKAIRIFFLRLPDLKSWVATWFSSRYTFAADNSDYNSTLRRVLCQQGQGLIIL